jgi:hypothetical protein
MSLEKRQQEFEEAIKALPQTKPGARIAKNFGFSNSARIIEGGLFACTNNLEAYSANLTAGTTPPLEQFIFLCVLTFPPQDEVYFAICVTSDASSVNVGLRKLYNEGVANNAARVAAGERAGKISNNVKFYITEDGKIYFHNNDFLYSVRSSSPGVHLDPNCLATIDSIQFAIWPPAASAQRSLLARQFVGYLGNLVGRENVHELTVWDSVGVIRPEMRRSPKSIPLADIEQAVIDLGGHYPNGELGRYHAAMNFLDHKHFVILSGVSGTGKTQLALKYARAVHGMKDMATVPRASGMDRSYRLNRLL